LPGEGDRATDARVVLDVHQIGGMAVT